jgi:hypothetical protein
VKIIVIDDQDLLNVKIIVIDDQDLLNVKIIVIDDQDLLYVDDKIYCMWMIRFMIMIY